MERKATKKSKKKLAFNIKSVRQLSAADLEGVTGGAGGDLDQPHTRLSRKCLG